MCNFSIGCSQSMMDVTRGDVTKNDTVSLFIYLRLLLLSYFTMLLLFRWHAWTRSWGRTSGAWKLCVLPRICRIRYGVHKATWDLPYLSLCVALFLFQSSISFAEEDTALVFDVETVAPREIGKQVCRSYNFTDSTGFGCATISRTLRRYQRFCQIRSTTEIRWQFSAYTYSYLICYQLFLYPPHGLFYSSLILVLLSGIHLTWLYLLQR